MSPFRAYTQVRELYALPAVEAYGVLLSWLPRIMRYLCFNILDDRLNLITIFSVGGQGFLSVGTLGHIVMAVDDRDHMANNYCAAYIANYLFFCIMSLFLRRKTARRLYHELVEYNQRFIQRNTTNEHEEEMNSLPRQLPILMIIGLISSWFNWFLYTISPLIFEWVQGKPIGSTKRLSTPVWPCLCDITTTPCFELNYVLIAFIWFFGVTTFVGYAILSQCYYLYISSMYRTLAVSIKNIRRNAETAARNSKEFGGEFGPTHDLLVYAHMHRLLDRYISQHQFLIRWSKEHIATTIEIHVFGVIIAPLAVGIGGLKILNDEDYVLDELPFIVATTLVYLFIICWNAQLLNDASGWIHWAVYTSNWVYADHALRKKINMMMVRSSRPMKTEHGLVGTILLDTFVAAINSAYGFLQTMKAIT